MPTTRVSLDFLRVRGWEMRRSEKSSLTLIACFTLPVGREIKMEIPVEAWMAEKDKDSTKGKHVRMDICVAMKRSLADIDKRIQNLIDA
jgi:hypothetical protein